MNNDYIYPINDFLSRYLEDLKHRDNEILILKDKVSLLEAEVTKLEAVIYEEDGRSYDDIVGRLEAQHKQGRYG